MAVIETSGSTRLDTDGSNRYLLANSVYLKYGGSFVTPSSFSGWSAIGAELVGGVYQVVWRHTSNQYVIWRVDTAGNTLSIGSVLSSASPELRSLEAGFNQNLNNDGGIETPVAVESSGATRLGTVGAGAAYLLAPTGNWLGPQLRYGGALVTSSTFSSWGIRGVEFTGSVYEVVWQSGSQWTVWNVDSAGNFLSQTAILNATQMQAYEPAFGQDFSNNGLLATRSTIETSGATTLAIVASSYFALSPTGSSTGPVLKRNGAPVTSGQFGAWAPRAAELSGGVYRIAWQNGAANEFIGWDVDASGNFISQGPVVAGTSWYMQSYETVVGANLNGDGVTGVVTSSIELGGNTTLTKAADSYFFNYATTRIQIRWGGGYAAEGQFGAWVPRAAEWSGGAYRVAWQNGGASQFIAWDVDAGGNFMSQSIVVAGTSWYLQTFESVVGYNLNGDGVTGVTTASIEVGGNTTLTKVADSYFFNYGSSNIQVRRGGAYAGEGQYGAWVPRAVEFVGGYYQMAWQNGSASQFVAWTVNSGGDFIAQGPMVTGASWYLQSFETVVGYNLNGDGVTGVVLSSIESSGVSSLTKAADSYFIGWGSTNVQVRYGGDYAAETQFGNWRAVGAEQTVGGYMVAWRDTATLQYTVWNLDFGGNYLWNSAAMSNGSAPMQAIEAAFQQDMNGGGIAGRSYVDSVGSTLLANVAGYLLLDSSSSLMGPLLSLGANYVTSTQGGTALGAEWTGNGYLVAWKNGTNYNFWSADRTGQYVGQTGNLAGSSAQMQNYEYTFNQDLNSDGVIGINSTPFDIQVVFSGLTQYQSYFEQAAQRWENIIRGDLPSFNSATYGLIDDLRIDASVTYIDGVGQTLGQATWTHRRSSGDGGLPYRGFMQFDSADVTTMVNNGTFLSVVMHEMGHVLGIGTLWTTFNLISGSSYVGANANNAYRQLGGSGFVPLETGGGAGTAYSHWSETRFDRELMTGYSESSGSMPLSIITVGGLADLGYVVDYNRADSYALPVTNLLAPESASASAGSTGSASSSGGWCGCGCIGGSGSPFSLGSYDLAAAADVGGIVNPDFYSGGLLAPEAEPGYGAAAADDGGIANADLFATGLLAPEAEPGYGAAVADEGGIVNSDPFGTACLAPEAEGADVSLLTSYMASTFVSSLGEGATGNAELASTQDTLARPTA